MLWSKKNKQEKLASEMKMKIDIVAHSQAKREIVNDARRANAELNEVLEQNHFTVHIFRAMGGEIK